MSGLFDVIRGLALVAGGSRAARMEKEKAESENRYREEDISVKREGIASNKELAEAQRKHTELLQEKGFTQEEKMLGKKIDWEKKRLEAEQEFTKSESNLVRDNAVTLAELRIQAEKALQERGITAQADLQKNDLALRLKIAQMDEALRNKGFKLEGQKIMQDFTLGKMGVMVNILGLATKSTQGTEGLMTAISRSNPEMAGILNSQEKSNLNLFLNAIDPDGKLGLKGHDISKYITPAEPVAQGTTQAASELASKLGIPGAGAIPKPPLKPASTMTDTVATLPQGTVSPPFTSWGNSDLHPGDQLGLDKVSSQIMALPASERPTAFGEYNQLIHDPNNAFVGGNDPEYRKKMVQYLGKSTGFDITK